MHVTHFDQAAIGFRQEHRRLHAAFAQAVAALHHADIGYTMSDEQTQFERALSQTRQAFGDAPTTAAWAEGQALILEEAFDLAVSVASGERPEGGV